MKQFWSLGTVGLSLLLLNPVHSSADAAESGVAAMEQMRKEAVQEEQRQKSQEAVQKAREWAKQLREPIVSAAQEGLGEAIVAIDLLDQGRAEPALEHLQKAEGKLDTAVSGNPDLMFATISSTMEVFNTFESNEDIQKELSYIENLLEDNRVQEARRRLNLLRDEIIVTTKSLPLGSYPIAIKEAVADLSKGKMKEARDTLETAMNSLVISEVILPVPLLMAKDAVERASNMNKNQKDQVLETLEFAETQLEKAELLGYVSEDSRKFERIEENIENLQDEVEGDNQVEKFYEQLKKEMNTLWGNLAG